MFFVRQNLSSKIKTAIEAHKNLRLLDETGIWIRSRTESVLRIESQQSVAPVSWQTNEEAKRSNSRSTAQIFFL